MDAGFARHAKGKLVTVEGDTRENNKNENKFYIILHYNFLFTQFCFESDPRVRI